MIDDEYEVSGIVDWELSTPLPFGMGFSRIHTIAGEFCEGKFYHEEPAFEKAEKGFWEEIFDGIPPQVRHVVDDNLRLVQIAVTLGTLLNAFPTQEDRLLPYNPVAGKALPELLTYEIPQLRGSRSPYLDMNAAAA